MENFHVEISEDLKSGEYTFRSNYVIISIDDYKKNFNNWEEYKRDLELALEYYSNRVKNTRRELSSEKLEDIKQVSILNFITCKSLNQCITKSENPLINKNFSSLFNPIISLDSKFKV